MSHPCIFCERTDRKLTNGHVFGEWIAEEFGRIPEGTSQLVAADGSTKNWPAAPFTDTVRVVCECCNSGWMSAMEGAVKDILGPMMTKGWTTTMSTTTQTELAGWALKTALVIDHLHPRARVVPDSAYPALCRSKGAHATTAVWIGKRNEPWSSLVESLKQQITTITLPDEIKHVEPLVRKDIADGAALFRFTFAVGHVAFQVFDHTLTEAKFNLGQGSGRHDTLRQIWPVHSQVTWPPSRPINDMGGIPGLHAGFNKPDEAEPPPPAQVASRPNRAARRAAKRAERRQ